MKSFDPILQSNALFDTIPKTEIPDLLSCLKIIIRPVISGIFLLHEGDCIEWFGIVLDGHLQVSNINIDGNQQIITSLSAGDYFAEVFCLAGVKHSPVSVCAITDSKVALFPYQTFIQPCDKHCQAHQTMIQNMLHIVARKNLLLQNRMVILNQKNIREKLLFWLHSLPKQPDRSIQIPFNRNQMAEFLCVDRSALSRELAHMRQDGLIEYHKNIFRLIK